MSKGDGRMSAHICNNNFWGMVALRTLLASVVVTSVVATLLATVKSSNGNKSICNTAEKYSRTFCNTTEAYSPPQLHLLIRRPHDTTHANALLQAILFALITYAWPSRIAQHGCALHRTRRPDLRNACGNMISQPCLSSRLRGTSNIYKTRLV